PYVGRIEVELPSNHVDHPLACPGFDRPWRSVRAVRALVARDHSRRHGEGTPGIWSRHHHGDQPDDPTADERNAWGCALVQAEGPAHAEERAVTGDRRLESNTLFARLTGRLQVFVAVFDPLDRAPEPVRCRADGDVLAMAGDLQAEGATDVTVD